MSSRPVLYKREWNLRHRLAKPNKGGEKKSITLLGVIRISIPSLHWSFPRNGRVSVWINLLITHWVFIAWLRQGLRRKHHLYYWSVFNAHWVSTSTALATENTASPIVAYSLPEDMFTGTLPSKGFPSIVGCALVGTCLPSNGVSWLQILILCANPTQKC
jgi:hypothetical protein